MPTKERLQKQVQELEEENDRLQDQLDQIYDIVAPPEEQGRTDGDALPGSGSLGLEGWGWDSNRQ